MSYGFVQSCLLLLRGEVTEQALTTQQATQPPTQQTDKPPTREGLGWLSMVLLMVLFPLLFFICVFIPIWLGVTTP